ncbi:MAG: hypothetical protein R3243_16880 [Arenibacter latericius]|nr:hypothetical protein [Arenibacter latericius]
MREVYNKPEKIRVERLSRRLYNIVKVCKSEHKEKASNQELKASIIEHRERFNGKVV